MPVVDRTHVRISRIGTTLAGRVRDHHFGFGANVGIGFAQRDGIAVALRHLAAVEAWNAGRLRQLVLWFVQHGSERKELCLFTDTSKKVFDASLLRHMPQ